MTAVFLNGHFIEPDQARVSAFDAGFQHGVGVFETMSGRVEDGRGQVFRLDEHLDRLIASARELGLGETLRHAPLSEAVLRTLEHSGLPRARVRLTVTGGDLNLLGRPAQPAPTAQGEGASARKGLDPTVLLVAQPATPYPQEMFDSGVTAVIADTRVNPLDPLAGHKTLNYWGRLRELQSAAQKRAGEAILFQVSNHLAGGCVSNIFLVREGELWTPIARGEEEDVAGEETGRPDEDPGQPQSGQAVPQTQGGRAVMPSPVLPGITRGWILEWAAAQKVPVRRRMLSINDLLGAEEVFLTNSSWGVLPVVAVEKERIGPGGVGELTRQVRNAWLEARDA
jgi:branched-chain amino acid aminotransferase